MAMNLEVSVTLNATVDYSPASACAANHVKNLAGFLATTAEWLSNNADRIRAKDVAFI